MNDARAVVLASMLTGCWTSSTTASDPKPEAPAVTTNSQERRATLRIDKQDEGQRFRGVWLELADGKRWLVDYRARQLWQWFADREVIVTGGCYEPFGHAIMATHFRVDQLRAAQRQHGVAPYLAIGPEQLLEGELVMEEAPGGSKLAGSSRMRFRVARGTSYPIVGERDFTPAEAVVRGRELVPDMTFSARGDGPDLWIVDVHEPGYVEDPAHAPRPLVCP